MHPYPPFRKHYTPKHNALRKLLNELFSGFAPPPPTKREIALADQAYTEHDHFEIPSTAETTCLTLLKTL